MPISRITLRSDSTGKDLIFDLNAIQEGWVAQIIEGTFGINNNYTFTDGNLTSVESSNIDINVRLTPVVAITGRTPESILNFINGTANKAKVTLVDTDTPGLRIDYKMTGDVSTARLVEFPTSNWSQECIIREIKYNYSENPATIEFTISTTKPFLEGSTLDFYYGIRKTPSVDLRTQFQTIFNRLVELEVYGDIEGLAMIFDPVSVNYYRRIEVDELPYRIFIRTADNTKGCELWINKSSSGYKNFAFRGGANDVGSYGYITEAYPMFSILKIRYLLENYTNTSRQIQSTYGATTAWIRFIQVKRGL